MKVTVLAAAVVAILAAGSVPAMGGTLTRVTTVITTETIGPPRIRRYVAPSTILRRKNMLCVMTPDAQVALDWPGPFCRYRDNFILPPRRHRHARWYR
jgi:hypothetical protein